MRITHIETLHPRMPVVQEISSRTQDALLFRVHTAAGIVGIGQAEASPDAGMAAIDGPCPGSFALELREAAMGEGCPDVVQPMLAASGSQSASRSGSPQRRSEASTSRTVKGPVVLWTAKLETLAALTTVSRTESPFVASALSRDLLTERYGATRGYVAGSDRRGVGVQLDEAVVEPFEVGQNTRALVARA
jgi:L-alanine-DL-glutamate epimerase-like enolase superfamily enzyme